MKLVLYLPPSTNCDILKYIYIYIDIHAFQRTNERVNHRAGFQAKFPTSVLYTSVHVTGVHEQQENTETVWVLAPNLNANTPQSNAFSRRLDNTALVIGCSCLFGSCTTLDGNKACQGVEKWLE